MSDGKDLVIIRGVDNSSSVHADNRKRDILILGKSLTNRLDDTKITAEVEYSINFREQQQKNLPQSTLQRKQQLFVNGVKIYHFKAKDSEIKPYELCLYNISKDFTVDNLKNAGFYRYVYNFSGDYDNI